MYVADMYDTVMYIGARLHKRSERIFRRILPGGQGARRARRHALQYPINIVCAAPFLVREHITANLLLLLLNEVDIREHAVLLELLCQFCGSDGAAMKTGERNELEEEALLCQIPDKRLELSVAEPMLAPVEARTQVVHEPPGYFARILRAKYLACSRSGSLVSSQIKSAYGANAIARLMAGSIPPVTW